MFAASCQDTDGGAVDKDGDPCSLYIVYKLTEHCGSKDDTDFSSNEMCCVCGGGSKSDTNSTGIVNAMLTTAATVATDSTAAQSIYSQTASFLRMISVHYHK